MALLTPPRLLAWINGSLAASGFERLDDLPLRIWRKAVRHGKPALPPGFLGTLFERLTGRPAGPRLPAPDDPLEREFLFRIASAEGFEHLEGLFAWCLVFAERVIETFTKDIIRVEYVFSGFRPSAFAEAGEFLRHFLSEKGYAGRITQEFEADPTRPDPFPPNVQAWIVGPARRGQAKFVAATFPQDDEFAATDPSDQERLLGERIGAILEEMVDQSWR